MTTRQASISLGAGLTPREAATDALYRFTQGVDDNDEAIFRSAFTPDATLDMSRLSVSTGKTHQDQTGIENLVRGPFAHVGPMDSAHHLSNVRVKINNTMDRAEVTCYAWAQHFRPGEGKDPSNTRHLTMGSAYWADVVRVELEDGEEEGVLWRIQRLEIRPYWCEGDLGVVS